MVERRHRRPVGDGDEREFAFRKVLLFKRETLGTGSYGAVCKAKCDQLICAAKLLYPVLFKMQAPDPDKEHRQPFRRFELECQFLSRINHPNIVQYMGTYRDPETNAPVLLMELMDTSLTHFLVSSPGDIPYHVQVNLSQDIAQALAFLHANGIIHRDLSSNNVLLIGDRRAKVSDFGMSTLRDLNATHQATMTQCPGTPAFMSPEALDEPPVYTDKLDNFSFGVILIQLLTKLFPKPGDRFETETIPNRRFSKRMVAVKVPVPEVERRQAHISLIEPTHLILPIALECLKDEAVERPSSQQLCQSLGNLKRTVEYKESQQHDMKLLGILREQVLEKDEQIRAKDQDFRIFQKEKDEKLQEKDQQMRVKDQDLQALQHKMEKQVRILSKQLESNEKLTSTLNQTISQRDREIEELRQPLATQTGCDEASQAHFKRNHAAYMKPDSGVQLSMSWKTLSDPSVSIFIRYVSAVVGERAYFKSGQCIWQFTSTHCQWNELPSHPFSGFTIVAVENELVTVGGYYRN